jgi:hypothetical protein
MGNEDIEMLVSLLHSQCHISETDMMVVNTQDPSSVRNNEVKALIVWHDGRSFTSNSFMCALLEMVEMQHKLEKLIMVDMAQPLDKSILDVLFFAIPRTAPLDFIICRGVCTFNYIHTSLMLRECRSLKILSVAHPSPDRFAIYELKDCSLELGASSSHLCTKLVSFTFANGRDAILWTDCTVFATNRLYIVCSGFACMHVGVFMGDTDAVISAVSELRSDCKITRGKGKGKGKGNGKGMEKENGGVLYIVMPRIA